MARTTAPAVQAILGGNWDGTTDLTPYLDTANALVTRVAACAARKGAAYALSVVELELIERWMAAHYYTQTDPLYASRSTAGASGSFRDQDYKKVAVEMDSSGCLNALLNRLSAGMVWLGKPPSGQTDYDQRD